MSAAADTRPITVRLAEELEEARALSERRRKKIGALQAENMRLTNLIRDFAEAALGTPERDDEW